MQAEAVHWDASGLTGQPFSRLTTVQASTAVHWDASGLTVAAVRSASEAEELRAPGDGPSRFLPAMQGVLGLGTQRRWFNRITGEPH